MFFRELNAREVKMLHMIRNTTFYDVVDAVRKDIEYSRHNVRKELRDLNNEEIKEIKEIKDIKEIKNKEQMNINDMQNILDQ